MGAAARQSRCCREAGKYLILMAPIVVEGSANESTPDQLGVTVLYL